MDNYYWKTDEYHSDNNMTMNDYLENEMDQSNEVILVDGTYAVIKTVNGVKYTLQAKGNGDSFNHIIEFELLTDQ